MKYISAILGFCAALVSFPAAAHPLSLEEITDASGMTTASLSPDGRHIAAILFNGVNRALILIDTDTLAVKTLSGATKSASGVYVVYMKGPYNVTWADNEVLAVDYGDEAKSMDLEGIVLRKLGESVIGRTGDGATGDVLVMKDRRNNYIARCKARTAECTRLWQPSGEPLQRAFDKQGNLRAMTVMNTSLFKAGATVSNWYKPAGKDTWTKLTEAGVDEDYWVPVFVPDEPHTLVINSRAGRDTRAIFNYDTVTRAQSELLAGHPTQDILSFKGVDKASFDYVATGGMMREQVWFDPVWAAMQKQIDVLLPGRVNRITGDPRRAVLVLSQGDVDPGTWYYFDIEKKSLVLVGKTRSSVDPERMRPMEVMRYKAADGLSIPAYLTRPAIRAEPAQPVGLTAAQGPGPMIVLIHGGPLARDHWAWDADVQLLANRGYLVFQPQFRGSSGFGRKFEEAGFGEWGKAMQDDITAGVRHLVEQGIADPQRICIVGASYGGYAALWGLVKTPELYRCAISFAGVTDIGHLFSDWSDLRFDKASRQMMARHIGDKNKSAELFDPVSPLKHASRMSAPVLLMHGAEDERVPIGHARRMRDALEASGKQVTWRVFEEEGHGLYYQRNQIAYHEAMLDFLGKHLPLSPTPPASAPAATSP